MKLLSNYIFSKRGPARMWISRRLERALRLELFGDPDALFSRQECELIKKQKKITIAKIRLELNGKEEVLYVKRYNAFSWRYRFGSLFTPSGAVRSLRGAALLESAGFATSRPVAAIEFRTYGMLSRSFFFSEGIEGGKTADVYWRENLSPEGDGGGFDRRRLFAQRLGKIFRTLHERNIYHSDLKDANILVTVSGPDRQEQFHLLDLEGIRRHEYLNRRRRIKNLVQLNRTMGRMVKGSHKLRCLRAYLGSSYGDRTERRKWIREILSESRRGDLRSLRKG